LPLLAPTPHRDRSQVDLIRPGMTLADVEALFGVPAGNYDWAQTNHWFWELHAWRTFPTECDGAREAGVRTPMWARDRRIRISRRACRADAHRRPPRTAAIRIAKRTGV